MLSQFPPLNDFVYQLQIHKLKNNRKIPDGGKVGPNLKGEGVVTRATIPFDFAQDI